MDFCIFPQQFPQNFGRSQIFIAHFSNILSVFEAGRNVTWDMPCITLKVFGSPVPHLFLLPSKYLQCGGFALPCYYWAQEANKEKLNIAFQYLKTKHMDFFQEKIWRRKKHP